METESFPDCSVARPMSPRKNRVTMPAVAREKNSCALLGFYSAPGSLLSSCYRRDMEVKNRTRLAGGANTHSGEEGHSLFLPWGDHDNFSALSRAF